MRIGNSAPFLLCNIGSFLTGRNSRNPFSLVYGSLCVIQDTGAAYWGQSIQNVDPPPRKAKDKKNSWALHWSKKDPLFFELFMHAFEKWDLHPKTNLSAVGPGDCTGMSSGSPSLIVTATSDSMNTLWVSHMSLLNIVRTCLGGDCIQEAFSSSIAVTHVTKNGQEISSGWSLSQSPS